jgi:hypothetical protein
MPPFLLVLDNYPLDDMVVTRVNLNKIYSVR